MGRGDWELVFNDDRFSVEDVDRFGRWMMVKFA